MESKGKEMLMGNHAKEEARQQLGKHLDTCWRKGTGKKQQEKDMNNYNFIIIIFRGTHGSWPLSKLQAFPAENTVPQNQEGQNTLRCFANCFLSALLIAF